MALIEKPLYVKWTRDKMYICIFCQLESDLTESLHRTAAY